MSYESFSELVEDEQSRIAQTEMLAEQAKSIDAAQQLVANQEDIVRAEINNAWLARNLERQGTSPESQFGPEGSRLCTDFLEFMKARKFDTSKTITHKGIVLLPSINPFKAFEKTRQIEPSWSIQGYGIGYIDITGQVGKPVSEAKIVSPYNVFLCLDGKLRYYGVIKDNRGDAVYDIPVNQSTGVPLPISTGYLHPMKKVVGWSPAYSSRGCDVSESPIYGMCVSAKRLSLKDQLIAIAADAAGRDLKIGRRNSRERKTR